jgi:hypothetical protein
MFCLPLWQKKTNKIYTFYCTSDGVSNNKFGYIAYSNEAIPHNISFLFDHTWQKCHIIPFRHSSYSNERYFFIYTNIRYVKTPTFNELLYILDPNIDFSKICSFTFKNKKQFNDFPKNTLFYIERDYNNLDYSITNDYIFYLRKMFSISHINFFNQSMSYSYESIVQRIHSKNSVNKNKKRNKNGNKNRYLTITQNENNIIVPYKSNQKNDLFYIFIQLVKYYFYFFSKQKFICSIEDSNNISFYSRKKSFVKLIHQTMNDMLDDLLEELIIKLNNSIKNSLMKFKNYAVPQITILDEYYQKYEKNQEYEYEQLYKKYEEIQDYQENKEYDEIQWYEDYMKNQEYHEIQWYEDYLQNQEYEQLYKKYEEIHDYQENKEYDEIQCYEGNKEYDELEWYEENKESDEIESYEEMQNVNKNKNTNENNYDIFSYINPMKYYQIFINKLSSIITYYLYKDINKKRKRKYKKNISMYLDYAFILLIKLKILFIFVYFIL